MKRQNNSIIVILAFLLAVFGAKYILRFLGETLSYDIAEYAWIIRYVWWVIPPILLVGSRYGFSKLADELRLSSCVTTGIRLAFIFTLPMLVGSALTGDIHSDLTFIGVLKTTLIAAFMEEFIFRSFLFGQLFTRFEWGFIPAVLLNAVVFAWGHLSQGESIGEMIGVFVVTLLGAAWFAWIYIEWDRNLWLIVFLHCLMNLSWTVFDVSENALGGWLPNIFRILTIAITVVVTIQRRKKLGSFAINFKNLWINKKTTL